MYCQGGFTSLTAMDGAQTNTVIFPNPGAETSPAFPSQIPVHFLRPTPVPYIGPVVELVVTDEATVETLRQVVVLVEETARAMGPPLAAEE